MRSKISKNIDDKWIFWRLINEKLCTYRDVFVDNTLNWHDVFAMHEYLDRRAYDNALSQYQIDKESKK